MIPKCFLSYSWDSEDHKAWVRKLATKLRSNGIDAILDQWDIAPGEHLAHFMEKSITECDFILIICTPQYKVKSDLRVGGVGFEDNIIAARLIEENDQRKIIPVIRNHNSAACMPSWLKGKLFVRIPDDISGPGFDELVRAMWNDREKPPELGEYIRQNMRRQPQGMAVGIPAGSNTALHLDQSNGLDNGQVFVAKCSHCGTEAKVPFRPTWERPVYCSECFAKMA